MSETDCGPSPLLSLPGAVADPGTTGESGIGGSDAGLAWHYGDPLGEQRAASRGPILLDRWNCGGITVTGEDRLTWLHALSSQHFEQLTNGGATEALWLSGRGHIEHFADVASLGDTIHLRTEPDTQRALLDFLESMKFWSKVELADVTDTVATLSVVGHGAADAVETALGASTPEEGHAAAIPPPMLMGKVADGGWLRSYPGRIDIIMPRQAVGPVAAALIDSGVRPAGTWAAAALRIPARRPRFGIDNDGRTIPNETPWLTSAVHLHKGCYRGQETVARVANIGAPPRRIVILNLDGSADRLPIPGDDVVVSDTARTVGRVGTVAQHFEEGPIALALVKRTVGPEVALLAGGVDAMIDPDDKTIVKRLVSVPELFNFKKN